MGGQAGPAAQGAVPRAGPGHRPGGWVSDDLLTGRPQGPPTCCWGAEHSPGPTPGSLVSPPHSAGSTLPAASPGSPGSASSPTTHQTGVLVQDGGRAAPWPMPQPLCLQIPGWGPAWSLDCPAPPPPTAAVPGPVRCRGGLDDTPHPRASSAGSRGPASDEALAGGSWGALPGPGSPEPSSQAPQASAKQVEQRRGRVQGGGR